VLVPAPAVARHHDDAALIELWLSLKPSAHSRRAYRTDADRFFAFAAPKPLAAVRLADLAAYADHLAHSRLRPASQNRALTAVKSLFSFAHQTGYLAYNVAAGIRLRPLRDPLAERILDETQIAHLIAQLPAGRDRLIVQLLYSSGIRVSELAALRWSDAQSRPARSGQITVFGKGGRTRVILLTPALWQALERHRPAGAQPGDAVFASRKGGGPLDVSQIRRIVYAAAQKAGLPGSVSPHWMRHAHASHALDRGAPIHLVQATLGHASVATTGRYLHARPADSSALYLPELD
jgi:integrase/recombinase XerD